MTLTRLCTLSMFKLTLVASLAFGASACGDGLGGLLISSAQEVEMGAGVDQQIRQESKIATETDPITVWARELTAPLVEASREFRNPDDIGGYKVFVIVDDELVNAFAAPGGYTYLTTGLIKNATTCGEIAGVMGHELGHVTERHSVKNIEGAFAVQIATEWFLGEGLASDATNTIFAFLQNTEFSQDAESESDEVGLQIAYKAGYNPYGLVDFFAKLLELQGGASAIPTFLSSHPATQDRIDNVSADIQAMYNDVMQGTTQTYDCIGTTQQLAAIQAHIASGSIAVVPGTGVGAPAEQPADSSGASE